MNTPFYIPHIDKFRTNIDSFVNEVRSIYPNYKYGYSFKTNSYKPFCVQAKSSASMAEIVSPNELKLAIASGFEYKDIIYNGVIPDFRSKLEIAKAGGIVNLENEKEIMEFTEYSNIHGKLINVGVRLNIAKHLGRGSRFGIETNSDFYKFLCNRSAHPYLNVGSIHCHIHGRRSLEMFERRIDVMSECATEIGASIIDIGGNMYGNIDSSFRNQYDEYVPTRTEYAHCVAERMKKNFPNCEKTLISEGGTLIISDCMDLITKVLNIRNVNGRTYVIVDTKPFDVGFVCGNKNPSIEVAERRSAKAFNVEKAIVEGCDCMEDDTIGEYSGDIGIGDYLVIKNVGAYSYSVRNSFITPPCKVKPL